MSDVRMKHSFIKIDGKKILTLDGVDAILGFDSEGITLSTQLGRVSVEGQGLKIVSLEKNTGELMIEGDISGVFYSKTGKEKNFFGRLFE